MWFCARPRGRLCHLAAWPYSWPTCTRSNRSARCVNTCLYNGARPIASIQQTLTAFLLSVLTGAKRFAHANWLRGDEALRKLLGLERFPTDDTIRNLFKQFTMGHVQRFFPALAEWQMQRLPQRSEGYTLDLDSTIFGALWPAGRHAERLQPAQTRASESSPTTGCFERSALPAPLLAPQRQLRLQPRSEGISRARPWRCGDNAKRFARSALTPASSTTNCPAFWKSVRCPIL